MHAVGLLLVLLHVDLNSRASSLPGKAVAEKLAEFADAHASLPLPEGTGRSIGVK